jgi:hypothetical protein
MKIYPFQDKFKIIISQIIIWLTVIAVFLLIFRLGNIKDSLIKPFDFLIALIGILILFNAEFKIIIQKLWKEIRDYLKYLTFLILFIVLGQILSYLRSDSSIINFDLFLNYGRVIFNAAVFLLTAILIFHNQKLIPYISKAIFVSPLLILPVFLGYGKRIYFNGGRLSGFLQDPNVFAGWIIVVFLIGLALFLSSNKLWLKFLIITWLCIIANFILWSGSRAGWLAIVFGLVIWSIFYFIQQKSFRKIGYLIIISIFAFSVGFTILPNRIKPSVLDRSVGSQIIKAMGLNETLKKYNPDFTAQHKYGFISNQIRTDIWKNILIIAIKNPFGFGFNYLNGHLFIINNETITFTTNIFLEIMIAGGIGALLIFLIILKKLYKGIKYILKNLDDLKLAWIVASLAVLGDLFFIDGFLFRYFWFVLGMVLGICWIERFKKETERIV